jgi:hypothetical protein
MKLITNIRQATTCEGSGFFKAKLFSHNHYIFGFLPEPSEPNSPAAHFF